ncbi:MAG: hypothetical protein NC826_00725 [Candidatus Omnitrophica bacterium]|nr:hypothetical protein [Candidatus Omnitrophota bacterium]
MQIKRIKIISVILILIFLGSVLFVVIAKENNQKEESDILEPPSISKLPELSVFKPVEKEKDKIVTRFILCEPLIATPIETE